MFGLRLRANLFFQIDELKQGGETFPLQGNSGKILGMVSTAIIRMYHGMSRTLVKSV